MKQRFINIMDTNKKKKGTFFITTAMVLLVFCGSLLGSYSAALEPVQEKSQSAAELALTEDLPRQGDLVSDEGESGLPVGDAADKVSREGSAMSWPVPGFYNITSNFGFRFNETDYHTGIDISGPDISGESVVAAADGKVTFVLRENNIGYGNYVIIDHGDGLTTLYAQCSEILVETGDTVDRGQPIAKVGRSGHATGYHLHFEIKNNGIAVDPADYLIGDQTEDIG